MGELMEKLLQLNTSETYPFHMPGHKRQWTDGDDLYAGDITEIDEFDNLHHSTGVLKNLAERWRNYYKANHCRLLVNGSTCGILAAICAATKPSDQVLICRNAHKSVYHAVFLNQLKAIYLWPQETEYGIAGSITPEEVENALKHNPDISVVVVTSPTYDGILSDIAGISKVAHKYGTIVVVDGAHGAHLPRHDELITYASLTKAERKDTSREAGEELPDLVIMSLHKTFPALTQTAVVVQYGSRVDMQMLDWYLNIYETSSPSYILLSSMEKALDYLDEHEEIWKDYNNRLTSFYDKISVMEALKVYSEGDMISSQDVEVYGKDRTKILISTKNAKDYHGEDLMETLRRKYQIECEMQEREYVTALSSVMDTEEGLSRLATALLEVDKSLKTDVNCGQERYSYPKNVVECTLWEGIHHPSERIPLTEAEGRISGEFAYLYPPGIPILIPGERISSQLLDFFAEMKDRNYEINGMADYAMETIKVLKIR